MRQIIIARKDLKMSPGKLAAQCCHASTAFLAGIIMDGYITGTDSFECDEETGSDGIGRTLTCIGFRPLPEETAHAISKKYQLYQ